MTLIANEIHMYDGFEKTRMIFAADRRLSNLDGSFHAVDKPKLLQIPYLNGAISYFGLATVYPGGRNAQYLADWLATFIQRNSGLNTFVDFTAQLRDALHQVIPRNILGAHASGFHIAGYNREGIPEFWYLSNIGGMDQFAYTNIHDQYGQPSPDFLGRDALTLGWDGKDKRSIRNSIQIYRNGDIRAHVSAWEKLDQVLVDMVSHRDFNPIRTSADLKKWVRFKFRFIAALYKNFARQSIIGTPIDVICLSHNTP
jgi:hypothetical protein